MIRVTCGVPQGTISGPWLFTILINGTKCNLVSSFKFVDDKTLAHSYSGDPTQFLQEVLNIEAVETNKDKMIINELKCNEITFNFSNSNRKPEGLTIYGNPIISCDKITLLGIIITDDLSWSKNTENICKKSEQKIFLFVQVETIWIH